MHAQVVPPDFIARQMELQAKPTAIYTGPSIYAREPVVCFALDNPWLRQPVTAAGLAALLAELPGLRVHACGPGFFKASRPVASTGVGHLFEHVCIELQNLAGAELSCVRTQALAPIEAVGSAVPYEQREVCFAAARLAGDLLAGLGGATTGSPEGASKPAFARQIEKFIEFAASAMRPIQDRTLIRAARARDIPVAPLVGRLVVFGHGRFQRRLSATKTSLTSTIANDLAANKDYAHRLLAEAGLPIPRYERVYSARNAVAAARRIGYPVVLKPNSDSMGAGVSVRVTNRRDVIAAFKRAREKCKSVLVQELIEGDDYRMLIIDGKLRAAAKRVPGHVVGDGIHNIEELVVEINRDPRRGSGHNRWWTRIQLDEQADRLLAERGCTRLSIPRPGEIIYLRRNANMSEGGTPVDVTDAVHPDNRGIAERAARAIGLDIAGVDCLTRDIATSMWENGGRICEINSRPGLRMHLSPGIGQVRDVLTPILDMLFPRGHPVRVPIVAITGTGDTRTTAHLVAHLLSSSGHHVGLSAGRRVYSGGRRLSNIRMAAPTATRSVLLDPEVDVAVLEVRPKDVLRHGLGCDAVSVVAVVNDPAVAKTHGEGMLSTQIVDAIRVVTRSARDVVCVEDTDPCAAAIERDGGDAELCRIVAVADGKRVTTHARVGRRRVVQDGDLVTIEEIGRKPGPGPIAEPSQAPPGDNARASVPAQCALHAVLAACSLGMQPGDIHRGLPSFQPPPAAEAKQSRRRRLQRAKAS